MLAVVFTSGALAMFLVKADGSKFDTSTLPPGSLISCVSWSPKGNYLISTAKWIWDSFIFSSIKPKLNMGLFVDFCVFTRPSIYLFLPVFAWCAHKIVFFWSAEQFYEHIIEKLVKTGKFTEINK